MRLIDANELKKALNTEFEDHLLYFPFAFKDLIDNTPTIKRPRLIINDISDEDIKKFTFIWQRATSKGILLEADRPHGKWIDCSEDGFIECPFCHKATTCDDNIDELHYCWNCGAKLGKGGADMRESNGNAVDNI